MNRRPSDIVKFQGSNQSGSPLKQYPHTADPDQQMGTVPRSLHHPGAGAADPWPTTSCFSEYVWWWSFLLHLFLPSHSTPHTFQTEGTTSLMAGKGFLFYIIVKTGQSNKPFRTALAVLEVSFIHMLLDGHEGLLQHWEGAAQRSPLSHRKA